MRVGRSILPLLIITVLAANNKDVFQDLNLDEALTLAKVQDKPVLVKFHADWCHYCRKMDRETFSNDQIIKALGEFITVKVNVDTPLGRQFARHYGVTGLPTIIGFNSKGNIIYGQAGFQEPRPFLKTLHAIEQTNQSQ